MPRTRNDQSREQKIEAILDAAERRLRGGGYGALSVAALARELELAQNSIYWYFPSKDHLFVAALERILASALAGAKHAEDPVDQVLSAVDALAGLQGLRAAVLERSRESPVVAEFEGKLRGGLRNALADAVSSLVPRDEADLATRAVIAQIEGSLLQQLSATERRSLLGYTLGVLAAQSHDAGD